MALISLLSCAVSSVVTSTTCDTNYHDTFNFKVFRYPGQVTGDKVYLRASVIVCLSNNADSVCQTECDDCNIKRKRRDTLEEIQLTEFYVTAGPFKIRDPDQGLWLKNTCAQLRKGYKVDRIILRTSEIGTPMVKVWEEGRVLPYNYGLDRYVQPGMVLSGFCLK